MRVVWSVTQVSSFGALASGGVFASAALASAAGLRVFGWLLRGGWAGGQPEKYESEHTHGEKLFHLRSSGLMVAPIIAAEFYAAWERQVKFVAGRGAGWMDVTKARARGPRERKGDEVHFSFFPALTDRANFWSGPGRWLTDQTGDIPDTATLRRVERQHALENAGEEGR